MSVQPVENTVSQPDLKHKQRTNSHEFLQTSIAFALMIVLAWVLDYIFTGEWFGIMKSPKSLFWIFLCCIKTVFIYSCYYTLRRIGEELAGERKARSIIKSTPKGWLSIISLAAFFPLLIPLWNMWDLWYFSIKFFLFTGVTIWIAWLNIECMWVLYEKFVHMLEKSGVESNQELSIEEYVGRRNLLQQLLLMNGVTIGLSTLAAGAMRTAIISSTGRHIPEEYVVIYGAYFTFVLAAIYIPTYLKSVEVGKVLLKNKCGLEGCNVGVDPKEWIERYTHHKHMKEYLDLNEDAVAHFRKGMFILTPFLGGIAGVLTGLK